MTNNDEQIDKKVTNFFASLADDTRLKILLGLTENSKTVNKIHNIVGKEKMTLSAISHQLRQLSDMGIVVHERKGKEKIYSLSGDFCWCILRDVYKHFDQKKNIGCERCSKIKNKRVGVKN
ncbi:MAG: metalloregulator ArsR/SmtB family transcription factor [Nanoarchaeota archaeon]|nr:metalloregulator ArsR/SmtB family transcription factor [Nanoarchaeota archaeon]